MDLSARAKKLKPSPTLALAARAKELVAQGKDVISLSVGEPDWPTLDVAVRAGVQAINSGLTKYAPPAGLPELRTLIAEKTTQELGVAYKSSEVTITSGAKFVLFSAFQCLLGSGDEVIIPAPYWVSYPTMVELADATPRIVHTKAEDHFRLTAEQLESSITAKTKMLILNSPSNPTGETYTKSELKALAAVLKKHPKIIILSDDIYNRLVFISEKIAPHLLHVAPELKDRVIVVNGASKSLSMTGWRVGWALGPSQVIAAMTDYQSQSVSCAAPFAQKAAFAALKDGEPEITKSVELLKDRRDSALEQLRSIKSIVTSSPDGAFYLWPNIEALLGKSYKGQTVKNSSQFCEIYLNDFNVAAVPGVEFGLEGYLRMSYVIEKGRMREAIERLARFVSELT